MAGGDAVRRGGRAGLGLRTLIEFFLRDSRSINGDDQNPVDDIPEGWTLMVCAYRTSRLEPSDSAQLRLSVESEVDT